jgi:hypothetical protein
MNNKTSVYSAEGAWLKYSVSSGEAAWFIIENNIISISKSNLILYGLPQS